MKLTSQEEYGLRCLLRVGREGAGGSLTIPELARAEGISEPNVAKMMRILRRAGFVTPTRGQSGGYALSRPAEEIGSARCSPRSAAASTSPRSATATPASSGCCTHMPDCSIRSVWRMVQQAVDQLLGKLTLKDLLKTEPEMNAWRAGDGPVLPAYSPQLPYAAPALIGSAAKPDSKKPRRKLVARGAEGSRAAGARHRRSSSAPPGATVYVHRALDSGAARRR